MIVIFIAFVIFLILLEICSTASLKFEIENLKINLPKVNGRIVNKDSQILLKIYLLKKIKIAQIDLKKIKTDNEKFKNRIDKLRQNSNFKLNASSIGILKNIDYEIDKMDLNVFFGVEDAAITAIGVGAISSIIAIMLKEKISNLDMQKYEVKPIYQNKNILKIEFNGIFSLKIANIIDMIKLLIKRRVNNNGRTSYRRSYAYSNE